MPICIPESLPATKTFDDENIFYISEERAIHQDIRPLKIVVLNLMPVKIDTETQLLRLLSNTPLQVDIELIQTATHHSKNTPASHLLKFYKHFKDIKDQKFDGMIITGAPVELLDYKDVDYWDELCEIMEWTKTHVYSTFYICWAAQAGLFYNHGVDKIILPQKMFGVFKHKVKVPNHPLMRGFNDVFYAPHSRHTSISSSDIERCKDLITLSDSKIAGPYIMATADGKQIYVTGHSEYDTYTLDKEFKRDCQKGIDINIPFNYYIDDNPNLCPMNKWKSHAHLLFSNWLNYFVYQNTPYDLSQL